MTKVYKNWGYLLTSNIFTTLLSFLTFLFLAKKLSPTGYGEFTSIIASITVFVAFANNIVSGTVINREIVTTPNSGRHIVKKALFLRSIGFILVSIGVVLFQYLVNSRDPILLCAIVAILFSDVFWELFEQIAFGYMITKITTFLKVIYAMVWFAFVIFVPLEYATLQIFLLVYATLLLFNCVIYGILDKKILTIRDEKYQHSVGRLIKLSLPYLWIRTIGTFGEQVPILLLAGFSGAAEAGFYAVGSKFVIPITIFISSGISAIFPYMTKLYVTNQEMFKKKILYGFSAILLIGSSIACVLTLSSSFWLVWLLGSNYASSVPALNYQIWFTICLGFDLVLSMFFSASYRQNYLALITTIDIIILLPLLYFSIPFGSEGVAVAKLLAAFIAIIYHILVINKILKIKLNNAFFILSITYFLLLFMVYLLPISLFMKSLFSLIIFILYSLKKNSPLRVVFSVIYTRFIVIIKKKEEN